MKLYKISLMALALAAGAFTSCSDDDNYVPGAESEGAYFPGAKVEIALQEGATSVELPVMRTSAAGDQTLNLTVTDESGLFNVPSAVSFDNGSKTANLVVTYDPEKLETDKPYTVTIAVPEADATIYGKNEATYVLTLKSPMETEESEGTYFYTQYWNAVDSDLPVDISYSTNDPNIKTYTVHHWGYDVDLTIVVDFSEMDEYGTYPCIVPEVYTGADHSEYGPVYASDLYTYAGDEELAGTSYFNPETGLFDLYMIYYVDAGYFGYGYEQLQMAGYPDYSVSIEYAGMFTDPYETCYAIGTVNAGADVEEVIVANIQGTDVENSIDGMLDGSIETQQLGAGEGQEVRFQIPGAGQYTLIALSMSNGDLQQIAYKSYKINGAAADPEDANWETIGWAPFCDGWVLPLFREDPFDYIEYLYVEVQENVNTGAICIRNPYQNYIYSEVNDDRHGARIVFNIEDPEFCYVEPQYSGFSAPTSSTGAPWGEDWYVGDFPGLYMIQGIDAETIKDYMIAKEISFSTFTDGVISLGDPLFGGPDSESFGYNYGDDGYPVEIYLNDMQDSEPAMAPQRKSALRGAAKVVPALTRKINSGKQVHMIMNPSFNLDLREARTKANIQNRAR